MKNKKKIFSLSSSDNTKSNKKKINKSKNKKKSKNNPKNAKRINIKKKNELKNSVIKKKSKEDVLKKKDIDLLQNKKKNILIKKNKNISKNKNGTKRYQWLFSDKDKKKEKVEESDCNNYSSSCSDDNKKKEKKKFVLYKKKKNKSNNKKKKVILNSFQQLGLSENMCRSIASNLKYNKPTDIQKLCVTKILHRRDVICISKTGSGKSLVYLCTLIDILKEHNKYYGIRGLIILPTKELVIQIYKLCKKICKNYFYLNINIIIGGVSIIKQFDILNQNLDILLCTPGRLSFLLQETKLSLEKVEILIIDEADRLLELNYYNDMNVIYKSLNNSSKQTILVSATLPTNVENYFKLKLNNPDILFLTTDNTINEKVHLHFLFCRSYEKYALLLRLILIFKKKKLGKTMIFFCTKYHILFFSNILKHFKIHHSILYGNSDTSFRFEQINNFTNNDNIQFLLVTDVASRGINITSVQNVINYNLPFSPKLFIHRIGRACRTDINGYGISLLTYQDILYAYEICFFIGKKLKFFKKEKSVLDTDMEDIPRKGFIPKGMVSEVNTVVNVMSNVTNMNNDNDNHCGDKNKIDKSYTSSHKNTTNDVVYMGCVPHLNDYIEYIEDLKKRDTELMSLNKSILASYKLYYSMRPKVSKYVSTKCINKINKIGGLYKLSLYNHPHWIYENERCLPEDMRSTNENTTREFLETEKEIDYTNNCINNNNNNNNNKNNDGDVYMCNDQLNDEVDILFNNIINYISHNNNDNNICNGKITNDLVQKEIKNHNQENDTTEKKNNEHYEETNIENMNANYDYSKNKLISIIHNFENKNSNNKIKTISDELKQKLNQLKEKNERYQSRRNYVLSNDVNEFMDTLTYQISDEEDENEDIKNIPEMWKKIFLHSQGNYNSTSMNINDPSEHFMENKKKLSKRALKKLKKNENNDSNEFNNNNINNVNNIKNISFDDVLRIINEKKMKNDMRYNNTSTLDIKNPGFDLPPDETEELNKQRFVKKQIWDNKKRKFVLTEIDTFQSDEFGIKKKVNKNKDDKTNSITNLYEKWVKSTKKRIKNVGELEDENDIIEKKKLNKNKNKKGSKNKYNNDNSDNHDINLENDEKQYNINMLKLMHPEISEALSKNNKLTKKQQRIYKKYISGKYINATTQKDTNTLHNTAKQRKKQLQNRLRTDKKFRTKYLKIKKKKFENKMKRKHNLSSARERSLIILKNKK
ncbi:ATP-dependent RNA helicase DBP10, putative [Plasmodium reichenowi]|uniref:ATP-dependent RNA helicase DBP10, putative n=1 Tax=Plasmodium reichenowi TaxID=5854 RepID=A0A151LKE8_PLARE|nr:ATP-dependent RNA helicase DBP10, putative [Plasmodium reichenowi]KYN99357.1 ATP-dependent RNA helicase DBP10, putative [Plasmodium reichenowi]